MIYYQIYCAETEPILPMPVGEIRPYFEGKWRVRMFDRFLCPSGFTGSLSDCTLYLREWFHGRLKECGCADENDD